MSGNPSVQASFSGYTPDVRLQTNVDPKNVDIGSSRNQRNVVVSAERSGSKYGIYYNTTAGWNEMISHIPKRGDIYIYSDHGQIVDEFGATINVPGIKIGDGNAYLIDLPFAGDDVRYQILTELRLHTGNTEIHVTATEKEFWNNKLNCIVTNGNLILNRL